jgi:ribonuclease VapC
VILDSSALLVFLLSESGKDRVAEVLLDGATMTTVNFAEVAARYVLRGAGAGAERLLQRLPVRLVSVDEDLALQSAQLADLTWPVPLSLGDRVCLALGQRTEKTILTADRNWLHLARRLRAQIELVR